MKMAEIGLTGQDVDVLNGGDVRPDGRLLSVAEIQQGFRELLADLPTRSVSQAGASEAPDSLATPATPAAPAAPKAEPMPAPGSPDPATGRVAAQPAVDTTHGPATMASGPSEGPVDSPAAQNDRAAEVEAGWITVLAAHAGAGASIVALAIADAAAADGQAVHLVESAHPSRSGLVAASRSELGVDPSGAWRRGLRGQVTIDRRSDATAPSGWPATPVSDLAATVVDLGLPAVANLIRLAGADAHCVVVGRATVPGVRAAELALDTLADTTSVIVAMIGPARWPGAVTSSAGPRLRALRADGHVVAVPVDRHLEVTGPTHSPLPKSVLAAGRELLGSIGAATGDDSKATHPAPRKMKGIRR